MMKFLNLLMWVGQFGFSVVFPTLFFLLIAVWLQNKFGLGMWIVVVLGLIGILTSISTARSCLRSLCKAAQEASSKEPPPTAFNDHK
ncbi:MAG TPA: AtpZ/AtpI family protein [Candidatus Faecousia faecavium]|nr:AtpZ/AtpI family protein [Candidatus Faecousia faecavium]